MLLAVGDDLEPVGSGPKFVRLESDDPNEGCRISGYYYLIILLAVGDDLEPVRGRLRPNHGS